MRKVTLLASGMIGVIVLVTEVRAQRIDLTKETLSAVNVGVSFEQLGGKAVVLVRKDVSIKDVDEATFAKLNVTDFKDGTIELNVLSKLLPDTPEFSRGFIGIAFRIAEDNSKFECIYIRPTNGRADDQMRRNHSIQYFSYPDYKFPRLRKESPEKYESYADMGLNEWIRMKIVVNGAQARLYLNGNKEPSLIVNDLKLGADQSGGIGLFVDVGTAGRFADLIISR